MSLYKKAHLFLFLFCLIGVISIPISVMGAEWPALFSKIEETRSAFRINRPAVMLGILQQEGFFSANPGSNERSPKANIQRCVNFCSQFPYGTCCVDSKSYKTKSTDCSYKGNFGREAWCSHQQDALKTICDINSLDVDKVNIADDYGMGAAQFQPTTWLGYGVLRDRNPWNPNDAIWGMGLKLTSDKDKSVNNNPRDALIAYNGDNDYPNLVLPKAEKWESRFDKIISMYQEDCGSQNKFTCALPHLIKLSKDCDTSKKDCLDIKIEQEARRILSIPTNLLQLTPDGKTSINTGGTTSEQTIIFKAKLTDPDNDRVKLQVELRRIDENVGMFDDTRGGLKESDLVKSGSVAETRADGLINGNYHWRARAIDEKDNKSDWVEFGNNSFLDIDFTVNLASANPLPLTIITPYQLATATINKAYPAQLFKATGGKEPYTWSLYSNSSPLPPGLLINEGGTIQGTPTKAGTYNFIVEVKDSSGGLFRAGQKKTKPHNIIVDEPPKPPADTTKPIVTNFSVTPASIADNSSFTIKYTVSDSGGSGLRRIELLRTADLNGRVDENGWIEVGRHSLSGNGPVSNTFTDTPSAGTYWYGVHAVDGNENIGYEPQRARVTVTKKDTEKETLFVTLSANPTSGTAPLNGVSLTATVSGTAQGTINYTFYCNRSDLGTDITKPNDGKFDALSGATKSKSITCSYPAAGAYTAKVIVEQGSAPQAESRIAVTVIQPSLPDALKITTASLEPATATVNTPYFSKPLIATGGKTPYKWSLNPSLYSGSVPLPPVLSINKNGVIEGTPTQAGTYNFTVEVADSSGFLGISDKKDTRPLTLVVRDAPKQPAPTVEINASEKTVFYNSPVTISWTSANATRCVVSPDNWESTNSQTKVTLTESKTYTITCTGIGGKIEKSVRVEVEKQVVPPPPGTITLNIRCNGSTSCSIDKGQSATISWTSNGASCTDNRGRNYPANGSFTESPSSTTTYAITCSKSGWTSSTNSTAVTVRESAPCASNWDCTAWSTCVNNQQTQSCADTNKCAVPTNKPPLTQSCITPIQCNGISYAPCQDGKVSFCPPSGTMVCHEPDADFCNGQYWSPCQTGKVFYCPPSGDAQCRDTAAEEEKQKKFAALSDLETVRQGMLTLINNIRKENGLSPVVLNNQLNRVAQSHAEDMFTRPFYGHNTPEGKTPTQRAVDGGYLHGIGENIGKGWTSVEEAMTWWLNSPGHRANILNPTHTDVGIGVRGDSKLNDVGYPNSYNTYWVQDFGDSNSLFCNGESYNPCPAGQTFSCSSNGGVCQTPPLVQNCSDGTLNNKCSSTNKPFFCENGGLIPRASQCGCPQEQEKQVDDTCTIKPLQPPITKTCEKTFISFPKDGETITELPVLKDGVTFSTKTAPESYLISLFYGIPQKSKFIFSTLADEGTGNCSSLSLGFPSFKSLKQIKQPGQYFLVLAIVEGLTRGTFLSPGVQEKINAGQNYWEGGSSSTFSTDDYSVAVFSVPQSLGHRVKGTAVNSQGILLKGLPYFVLDWGNSPNGQTDKDGNFDFFLLNTNQIDHNLTMYIWTPQKNLFPSDPTPSSGKDVDLGLCTGFCPIYPSDNDIDLGVLTFK